MPFFVAQCAPRRGLLCYNSRLKSYFAFLIYRTIYRTQTGTNHDVDKKIILSAEAMYSITSNHVFEMTVHGPTYSTKTNCTSCHFYDIVYKTHTKHLSRQCRCRIMRSSDSINIITGIIYKYLRQVFLNIMYSRRTACENDEIIIVRKELNLL